MGTGSPLGEREEIPAVPDGKAALTARTFHGDDRLGGEAWQ